ncbi:MAG: hypothetical protein QMD05_07575 [Candidatus Brocadiaceae bacterium]|nr:hypothetical protein [Candidatus Brocadiaceae bacterium]
MRRTLQAGEEQRIVMMKFPVDFEELHTKAKEAKDYNASLLKKESYRQAITIFLGICCALSIIFIIEDTLRFLIDYHQNLLLTASVGKLLSSILCFCVLMISSYALNIKWKSLWTVITACFLLFGTFFNFYSKLFGFWPLSKLTEVEFWISIAITGFVLIVANVCLHIETQRVREKHYELMRLINSFCKKYPELGAELKRKLGQEPLKRRYKKEWLRANGEKF